MFKRIRFNAGMSLIEIMIVILIMGAIAALVGRNVISRFEQSKVQTTKLQMDSFKAALQDYYMDNNSYPTTDQGLAALIQKPTAGTEPTNYSPDGYLKSKAVPKDQWGGDYFYESDGAKYKITSLGKDKKEGGDGYNTDIVVESE
ncbi:MAG: type II secretion system major pseudopilin GspG [Pseudomonadota bacterium]